MPPHPDRVVVIGGVAAGFFGAIACGERSGGRLDIRILEGGRDVLQKVKISGGGGVMLPTMRMIRGYFPSPIPVAAVP